MVPETVKTAGNQAPEDVADPVRYLEGRAPRLPYGGIDIERNKRHDAVGVKIRDRPD